MVRCASGVTMMRQRPLGSPSTAGLATNSTPAARMSWPNTVPRSSSATRPMNAALPPSDATPTNVLAAEPPEISIAGPIAAYRCSARSVSMSSIAPAVR